MSSALLRSDFDPMVGGFVIIMLALAAGLRLSRRAGAGDVRAARAERAGRAERAARAARVSGPELAPVTGAGWGRLARHVAGTMLGGYLLLMIVVIVYYYLVARVGGAFIKSAFTGCALLIGLAAAIFAAASWLAARYGLRPTPARNQTLPGSSGTSAGESGRHCGR